MGMKLRKNFTACFIVTVVLVFSIVASSGFLMVWAFSGSGSGTAGDPHVITNVDQLQEVNDDLDAYYVLGNDIDASATSGWADGFDTIGDSVSPFTGHFDGQGYVIYDLYINRPSEDHVGLFGFVGSGGEITRVGLINVDITGDEILGGQEYVGGFVGENREGTITNCYSTGSVIGEDKVGGFAGYNWDGIISCCYSSVHLDAIYSYLGGFVGINDGGSISDCYSTGRVWGDAYVGGFSGANYEGTINNCYSTGRVDGRREVGVFAGDNFMGSITSCYWSKDTSGVAYSDGGEGKTTTEMKQQTTYSGWDFSNTWCINEGETYPHLRGMPGQMTATTSGSGNALFSVGDSLAITKLSAVAEDDLPSEGKPDVTFPHGFFNLTIIGLEKGVSATLNVTFPANISVDAEYWSHHKQEGWTDVTSLVGSHDGDNMLTYTVIDGGLGDHDGKENGVIVVQKGPGYPIAAPPDGGFSLKNLTLWTPYIAAAVLIIAAILVKKRKY